MHPPYLKQSYFFKAIKKKNPVGPVRNFKLTFSNDWGFFVVVVVVFFGGGGVSKCEAYIDTLLHYCEYMQCPT